MRKITKIFLGNKWGNKECIIINYSAMKKDRTEGASTD